MLKPVFSKFLHAETLSNRNIALFAVKNMLRNKDSGKGALLPMIKGVNRQVVEVNETQCEYFEKIMFFVKPEYASVSEGKIRERAGMIADSSSMPPPTKLKRNKYFEVIKLVFSALCGAAAAIIILKFIM